MAVEYVYVKGYCCGMCNSDMAIMRIFSSALRSTEIPNAPSELGTWSSVWLWIINIPTLYNEMVLIEATFTATKVVRICGVVFDTLKKKPTRP